MKNHVKVYFDYFGYDVSSFIPCEICGAKAVDINHVKPRGMGGSKKMDNIENLMAVCRECHIEYADKKHYLDFLVEIHNNKIANK